MEKEVTPEVTPKEKVNIVALLMARKNVGRKNDKRFTGKRIRQDSAKLKNIKKREKRLRKIGWNLFMFN